MSRTVALTLLILLTILTLGYTLPWLVAHWREHKNTAAIAVLNILTGWTFIGWVAALVWAFTYSKP